MGPGRSWRCRPTTKGTSILLKKYQLPVVPVVEGDGKGKAYEEKER